MRNRKQKQVLLFAMAGFGLLVAALLTASCGARQYHIATVSVVTAEAVAGAVQDTADAFVCGAPTSPPEGRCLSTDQRRAVAGYLSPTFDKIGQAADLVKQSAPDAPLPTAVGSLLQDATDLLNKALALLPEAAQKRVANLTGAKK